MERNRKRSIALQLGFLTTSMLGVLTVTGTAHAELPKSGAIVMFGQSRENPYFGQNAVAVQDIAKKQGWTFTYVEASSQEQQDSAIQQMLSTGDKPIGVVLNPVSGAAAVASEMALKDAGIPVVILNQVPAPEQADLFVAYGGVNDYLSGQNAAQLLIAGAKKAGVELGNGLIVNTVAGHTAAQQRVAGFKDEMKKAFPSSSEVLADVHSGGYLENEGYSIGSQIIPANKGKFNWVYGVNDALAYGAVRAAKESGIQPGKDVLFVGGTCMNSTTNAAVKKGELVGTSVQSPYIEGAAAMYALVAYLNTGKVTDGEQNLSPDTPLSIDAPPHKWNYMPNTMLDGSEKSYAETKIWGKTAQELCNYN
ncbi:MULTISPECIES: sugar ABC transporter substrate-binding protein [Rhizobium/Agrobacterium group]|uniref:sugar ABC transporter substrate-binding protein n=1 Tax=Rhizobium/Agrobacterium group TaxID=227290 RepID=UPI001ADCB2A9|nr:MULTISPECIES: sugar ABC transporter substrate-binding protein [Rhizobium/Agrobacterium group]MBO9112671.1 sugar ABC transporter substrate-binding protein [Agrobacterium sp. S2/73]QXZ76161.1 sugar ABC transporter substrate-binding protein [Agrobacterium sp. S7/73]QYA17290.1 sugar ABC transporter substrate-binding protein [Rhizobium sp. AB2/73]UEQ85593.1 sugar ABC transporter substrate-binding protein [Rhizobium sp. AB2/73]